MKNKNIHILPEEITRMNDKLNDSFKHKGKVIPTEEVLANRCNAYEFIDFDKQETIEEPKKGIDLSKYTIGIDPYNEQEIFEKALKHQFNYDNLYEAKEITSKIKVVETLEESAFKFTANKSVKEIYSRMDFVKGATFGAKWQAERMFSEEDMKQAYKYGRIYDMTPFEEWFEQFKKK